MCFLKKRGTQISHTQKKGSQRRTNQCYYEAETEVEQSQFKECWQPPKPGRGEQWTLPWSLQRRTTLWHLDGGPEILISDSGLKNYQRIHFCCFKPTYLQEFVKAIIQNGYITIKLIDQIIGPTLFCTHHLLPFNFVAFPTRGKMYFPTPMMQMFANKMQKVVKVCLF